MENRIIKFRVWNERYKEFSYWGFFDGMFKGIPTGSSISIEDCQKLSQQFTGLLDKNGKEIYEGDIVTCHTNNKFQYPHKGEVIYLQHICGFGITTEPIANEATGEDEPAFTYFNYNENFEVIGNILIAPELIKQESK